MSTLDPHSLVEPIRRLHAQIRDSVVAACEAAEREHSDRLAEVDAEEESDTIFAVDRISERLLVEFFEQEIAPHTPLVLIAEGLPEGQRVLPHGASEAEAIWRIIMDPIDGTRSIMYQKRPAWVLTGVAPNRGPETDLQDIVLAVQTEMPLNKQHLCDSAWSIRGEGVTAVRRNRLTGEESPLSLRRSTASTISQGYAGLARFFPGMREELSAIDDEIVARALGPVRPGRAHCFEDQYASTGGQLWELACGHDRFVADLRPLMERSQQSRGQALGLCCHPYDLCTELIARESGVIVTDPSGDPVRAPLHVEFNVAWVGYANSQIQAQIEPILQDALRQRGLSGC